MKALVYSVAAIKALKSLPQRDAEKLRDKLAAYAAGENAGLDVSALKGSSYSRLRHGDWRAVFEETKTEVFVIAIAHRREVY